MDVMPCFDNMQPRVPHAYALRMFVYNNQHLKEFGKNVRFKHYMVQDVTLPMISLYTLECGPVLGKNFLLSC